MWKGDKRAAWSGKQQGTQEAGLEGTLEHFWRELLGAAGISWGTELWGKWVGKKNWKAIVNEQVPHPSTFRERLQQRFLFFYKHLLWWMGTSPEYNTRVKTGLTLMSWGLYQNLRLYLSVPSTYTQTRKLPECRGWGFILPRRFCSQLVSSENKTKQNKTKQSKTKQNKTLLICSPFGDKCFLMSPSSWLPCGCSLSDWHFWVSHLW